MLEVRENLGDLRIKDNLGKNLSCQLLKKLHFVPR